MPPFVQQYDHILCDLCLCQKHLKHLVSEYLLSPRRRLYEPEASALVSAVGETENLPFDCTLIIAKQSVLDWQYATDSCKTAGTDFLPVTQFGVNDPGGANQIRACAQ